MSETVWERRDCVSAEVEDSLVLLDLDTLLYYSLNETAADVWQLLASPNTASQVTSSLCEKYDIETEQCRASVDRLLQRFEQAGLLKAAESDAAAQPA